MLALDFDREKRDTAERDLKLLGADPRATSSDRVNISLLLVQLAQRRGDHQGALDQLRAVKVEEASEAVLHLHGLKAISLTQLGEHTEAANAFDTLFAHPNYPKSARSGAWELEAGRTYTLAGRTTDAIRVTKRAISYFEKLPDELEHLTRAKSNLAYLMLQSDKAEEVAEAERSLERACDAKIALGDLEGASTTFSQLSVHHFMRGRFERALAYSRKDLMLSRFIGDDRMLATTLMNLAQIYGELLQISEARHSVQQAEAIGKRLNNPNVLSTCADLRNLIEKTARSASEQRIPIGKKAPCRCGSGFQYVDCCGRADHEPIALRMPISGPSQDIRAIKASLEGSGLQHCQLDYAMLNSEAARKRIAWSEFREHDGWFEIFELPDMANLHLNAAAALADLAARQEDAIHEPIACAMLAVSALEAFVNSTAYFASEAPANRSIELPASLKEDAFNYQRFTELTKKWDELGAALCANWPPPDPLWKNFARLVQLRNELVHYKAEGFSRVAPAGKHPPEHLRNLPDDIDLRISPSSWPIRLLTASFAKWAVSVANELIRYFRSNYRFAPSTVKGVHGSGPNL